MKRLWSWVKGFFSADSPFVFHRENLREYGGGRLVAEVTQRVYRRRRYLRRVYWYGTVHVRMRVFGVRLIYRAPGNGSVLGKVIYASENYALRRDVDYVFLLRHLLFLLETCNLSVEEQLFLSSLKEVFMEMWPPRSNLDIQVCVYDTKNGCNRIS
jgi:hypothetical protein